MNETLNASISFICKCSSKEGKLRALRCNQSDWNMVKYP